MHTFHSFLFLVLVLTRMCFSGVFDFITFFVFIFLLSYAQSKLVAEFMARAARTRGFPVNVYRPSSISGSTLTGCANTADFVERLLSGICAMQAAPDMSMAGFNLVITLLLIALHLFSCPLTQLVVLRCLWITSAQTWCIWH